MGRSALGAAGAALAAVLAAAAALLGREALPRLAETPGAYAARVLERGAAVAEDVYVQALLLLPGSVKATVTAPGAGGATAAGGAAEREHAKQDKLKQGVAKDEDEINAQQEVSVKRYIEAKSESGAKDEPLLVAPEQPDDVRSRMPAIDPKGPEMRCGQALLPESSLTTRDIELHAKAIYQGRYGEQYGWKYVVTFRNHGKDTVQMLTRHWLFVSSRGRLESEVKGPGARGVTPVLPPGGEWSYESGTSLSTPFGSMHGSFQFEILKGPPVEGGLRSFSARVGRLLLSSRKKEPGRKVPCVDAAAAERLPLTSVLVTERVILGGRAVAYGGKLRERGGRKEKVNVFHYDVQFNNARDSPVEIVAHSWEVVDAEGRREVIAEGPGVGGSLGKQVRALAAGDAFRVQGELTSLTAEANAQGTYKVIIKGEDNALREIDVRTDWMGLAASSEQNHVPNFVADPSLSS